MCFDFGNRLWVYNSAIDPRFSSLSAGWVLLAHLLQWAIENRRSAFDFMRGPEDYKLRFGGVPGKIYRLQVSRRLTIEELGGGYARSDLAPRWPDQMDKYAYTFCLWGRFTYNPDAPA